LLMTSAGRRMAQGIKDRVAIAGMGCTRFGEHWDKSATNLMVDAAYEAYEDAGVDPQYIPAAWLGNWQDKAYLLDYSM